mgnify:FL=1
MAKLHIRPDVVKGHINPEIQGHFSEHLGRCIYEGLYVGENSPIPNTNGMRNDVVEHLRRFIFLYFAGRVAALQTNIIGRMVLVQRKIERK